MELDAAKAILAGLIGTGVMTAVMYMGRLMNMRMDMPMMLGTMFLPRGQAAWALGLMIHLMMGGLFFLIYAVLFDILALETGIVGWSVVFALVHGAVAGMSMAMMPAMHPRMATAGGFDDEGHVPNPGMSGLNMGLMGPLALLVLHAVFGLVGGLVYNA
jgi:hypothetical protein